MCIRDSTQILLKASQVGAADLLEAVLAVYNTVGDNLVEVRCHRCRVRNSAAVPAIVLINEHVGGRTVALQDGDLNLVVVNAYIIVSSLIDDSQRVGTKGAVDLLNVIQQVADGNELDAVTSVQGCL